MTKFRKKLDARFESDDEALKVKIEKKAHSALKGQIAALESVLLDKENAVEDAEENLEAALYPKELFKENAQYIQSIVTAQDLLEAGRAEVASIQKSIKFYTGYLEDFKD